MLYKYMLSIVLAHTYDTARRLANAHLVSNRRVLPPAPTTKLNWLPIPKPTTLRNQPQLRETSLAAFTLMRRQTIFWLIRRPAERPLLMECRSSPNSTSWSVLCCSNGGTLTEALHVCLFPRGPLHAGCFTVAVFILISDMRSIYIDGFIGIHRPLQRRQAPRGWSLWKLRTTSCKRRLLHCKASSRRWLLISGDHYQYNYHHHCNHSNNCDEYNHNHNHNHNISHNHHHSGDIGRKLRQRCWRGAGRT